MMGCLDWKICNVVFVLFLASFVRGFTDPRDVYAINQLYASLGSPPLAEWVPVGGDPCGPPSWQGVECVISNITTISLFGANLGGELTDELGSFASIIVIDLRNNHIGGRIPSKLPTTLTKLFLSDNQFTGPIPDAVSSLSQLLELSLNKNQLTGPIPDVFQQFVSLTSLDLSFNNLSSVLPPSLGTLPALSILHLQNNQLSGMLDILQTLPALSDLDIENNLFSGPVPGRLLNIPSFRSDGNPFNTTPIASPPASAPPPLSPSDAPSPQSAHSAKLHGPSASPSSDFRKKDKSSSSSYVTLIAIAGLVAVVLVALGLCLYICGCCKSKRKRRSEETGKGHSIETYGVSRDTHKQEQKNHFYQVQKGSQEATNEVQPASGASQIKAFSKPRNEHSIDMARLNSTESQSGRIPLPLLPAERITADPIFIPLSARGNASRLDNNSKFYSIASLQQYTNSFSQENLIGKGAIGTVYRAHLPDGRVLAIKKVDNSASAHMNDAKFLELVLSISKLRHPNIVELVGYCLEHGQRLLVYNYCRNGTLNEALHLDGEIKKKLSWNARMSMALEAAKALEYLHETCNPSIIHRNFKSANVLLEEDLSVRVSDCGLVPLLSPNSLTQLQGSGYGARELELGIYSHQSDVYSFGVVMLELLTGRQSHDRSRPRGEQYLVRWAFSRLHDIDALSRMVDPSLNGAYPSKSLSRLADIISLCIQPEPEFRPPMSEIVQKLAHMIQRDG